MEIVGCCWSKVLLMQICCERRTRAGGYVEISFISDARRACRAVCKCFSFAHCRAGAHNGKTITICPARAARARNKGNHYIFCPRGRAQCMHGMLEYYKPTSLCQTELGLHSRKSESKTRYEKDKDAVKVVSQLQDFVEHWPEELCWDGSSEALPRLLKRLEQMHKEQTQRMIGFAFQETCSVA